MIDVKELRVGNLFQDEDNTPCYFAGAWQRADGWIVRDSANNTYKPSVVYPIPLSAEVLEACGFTPTNDKPYIDQDAWSIGESRSRLIFSGDRVHKLLSNGHYLAIVAYDVMYLHQLQNIVHALSGDELTFNLDKVKV